MKFCSWLFLVLGCLSLFPSVRDGEALATAFFAGSIAFHLLGKEDQR